MLEGVHLEIFEPKIRRAPLMPLLCPWEGALPWLRRGAATAHRVLLCLGVPFTTMRNLNVINN